MFSATPVASEDNGGNTYLAGGVIAQADAPTRRYTRLPARFSGRKFRPHRAPPTLL